MVSKPPSFVRRVVSALGSRFGEDSIEKMVSWAIANVAPSAKKSVLEVGSGNGTLLFAMCEAGYSPDYMLGIDYSADAVKLARAIAPTRNAENLAFEECDFLYDGVPSLGDNEEGWDLVLDKGTYDAIALAQKDDEGRFPAAGYPKRLASLLRPNGYFLITCRTPKLLLFPILIPHLQHAILPKTSCGIALHLLRRA
jgi:EEF1A lysine methyltransferase 2